LKYRILAILLTFSTVLTIIVNALANVLPFNGQTTEVISDKYFNYFTPAGITFAIWGVIYIGWIAFTAYFWLARSAAARARLERAVPWFLISSVANSSWLVLWHYEQLGLSVLVMLVILGSLIKTYLELNSVSRGSKKTKTSEHLPMAFSWLARLPVSIYLGWISVATIANIAAALTQGGFTQNGESWGVIMILVAVVLSLVMLIRHSDVPFVLVVIWAALGIGLNFIASSYLVAITSFAAVAILAVGLILVGIMQLLSRLDKSV
jgi:hypothetical protein